MTAVQKAYENSREALAEISEHYENKIEKLRKELAAAKEEIAVLQDRIFMGVIPPKVFLSRAKTENVEIGIEAKSPRRQEYETPVSPFPKIKDEISRSPLQARFPENKFLQFSFSKPPPLFPKN